MQPPQGTDFRQSEIGIKVLRRSRFNSKNMGAKGLEPLQPCGQRIFLLL
ncbi:MAG: hypothetical protein KME10_00575 [Plectolyngbya sp. WJT66-NPBG17]|nr:hypothetical protein [Plectolyngbya sp. WJT66-NPBG17]MBW4523674.1 hypothetical protein [Phormidium tanganyikae FI6-MK23]